ncbi:MAG: MBOAT family protein [Ruminococcaceae bacterium]|nr:MBOAT family protein [Oscillospiraceae bacterium]
MNMISLTFFAFTAVVFCALWLCGRFVKNENTSIKLSKAVLLVSSYIFVLYADVRFAAVLAVMSFVTYLCAKDTRRIAAGVAFALVCLGYFKYTNFFAESFARLVGRDDFTALNIILPLGISFYVFSAISYLVDVKRGRLTARNFADVALYLSFFPKLTSGPVQRSGDFFAQFETARRPGWNSFSAGVQIFAFGAFKKLVLADRLSVFVNQVYSTPEAFSWISVTLAVLSYSAQIYFDFSGYSDMAIGIAKMFDINLPRNFNLPYLSRNVTELWKRWHISLSSWLQEYLYISLGGNRKGKVRTYINLVLTMVLGGIWHGASWNYILWGLLHGLSLAVHKLWVGFTHSSKKAHSALSAAVCTVATFAFTSLCWVFFRIETTSQAMVVLRQIFTLGDGITHLYIWSFFAYGVLAVSTIAAAVKSRGIKHQPNHQNTCCVEGFYPLLDLSKFWHLVIFFVFCGLIIGLCYTGGSPFIYGAY